MESDVAPEPLSNEADVAGGEEEDVQEVLSEWFMNHPAADNRPFTERWPDASAPVKEEEDDTEYVPAAQLEKPVTPFVPPSKRLDAPLATILNPQLDCVDPKRFFPDFDSEGILRFSRIFASNIKSTSRAEIWWPSKTYHKKQAHKNQVKTEPGQESEKKLELNVAPPPKGDDLQTDQEVLLLRPSTAKSASKSSTAAGGVDEPDDVPPWRFGPARIWYDRMNVPAAATHFDYGFKLKQDSRLVKEEKGEDKPSRAIAGELEPETFLPVNLVRWEDDIIYDGEQIRQQVMDELKTGELPACGWIPTQHTRTYQQFVAAMRNRTLEQMFSRRGGSAPTPPGGMHMDIPPEPTPTHSIFPMENHELLHTRWEDDIIWDDQAMDKIPEPKVLTLDYYDDPLIFGMPEDRKGDEDPGAPGSKPFDRKEHQFTKKSKMILGQVQQRQKQEEEEQMETSAAQSSDKDPFNLSNDHYYLPKAVVQAKAAGGSSAGMLIQHSIPANNIHRTFFPTHLNPGKLRHFHRMPLSRRIVRAVGNKYIPIQTLTKHIKKMEELRERQKQAEGGGDIFFMREVADLSGRDGDLLMIEYSEEHPPLLSQPGMAAKIRNYYKRKAGKDQEPEFDFGETAFSHNSPFLGQLHPGQAVQSIENNLYRAPIYRHQTSRTDFLLIRTKQGYYIRRLPALFLAGQECPLYEVPSPNSKRATVFVRDFLLAFIYRLFWASEHNPRRLKMEDIKAAFPHYAESSVRKRLKQCSDFKRLGTGPDQNYWVLRSDFRLPSKEEVLSMVTPEMCCAQYSMLAAEQRLKDAGYGEKYFFTPENEDDSDDGVTIEDEIKCAPWNTTRAFLSSMRGKCLLDQTGIADPSGNGQGFSYVRVSAKPQKEDVPAVPKRLVTGTNADLRKLPLKEAKEICRDYGVREEEINALTRWEIIDVIRTLSTQAAKARSDSAGGDVSGMARFARGNIRFNFADMQEKYKKHCQHIFDLQNQVLSNPDALSTDEGSSGEDSDNEELATTLESMLSATKGKKGISMSDRQRVEFENEEREREDLKRMIHGEPTKEKAKEAKEKAKEATEQDRKDAAKLGEEMAAMASKISGVTANRKLRIHRTIINDDGTEETRTEVVTRPQLIEAYARIRMTKDETFIQVYAQMDEQYKEERRREKRRLQDQLRRIKRNEQKAASSGTPMGREKKAALMKQLKTKCSKCGGVGHMKTNKACPMWGGPGVDTPTKGDGSNDEMDSLLSTPSMAVDAASTLEGTKLSIKKSILTAAVSLNETPAPKKRGRPRTRDRPELDLSSDAGGASPPMRLTGDGDDDSDMEPGTSGRGSRMMAGGGKRRISTLEEEYLHGPMKSTQRARADPRVTMATNLTEIVVELKTISGSEHLMAPVSAKKVKDYYDIVKTPMDLQQIKNKITANKYELRKDFLLDIKQMLDNSRLYNGDNHVITEAAMKMFELAGKRIMEKEHLMIKLEKAINPLMDENDRVGFCFILGDILQKCKNIPKSVPFHMKVDARKVPTYYEKIKNPMDLGTMEQYIREYRYSSRAEFKRDIDQILSNSIIYNGPVDKSQYSAKAAEIVALADRLLSEKANQLAELEANMRSEGGPHGLDDDFEEDELMTEGPGVIEGEEESDGGVLHDDLAMSGNEMDEEDEMEGEWNMEAAGQLNNDLALSDSDNEDLAEAKRPKMEEDLMDSF